MQQSGGSRALPDQVVDYIINAVRRSTGGTLDDEELDIRAAFSGWEWIVLNVCEVCSPSVCRVTHVPRVSGMQATAHLAWPCSGKPTTRPGYHAARQLSRQNTGWHLLGA